MVITGSNLSIRVENGKIVEFLPPDPKSRRYIAPKSFDINVKNSESVLRLSQASRNGGVGHFLMIPAIKPIANKLQLSYNLKRANEAGFPILVAVEGIHQGKLTEIATLHKKGAKGIYINSDEDLNLIRRVLEYGELLDIPILVNCNNKSLSYGVMAEGEMAYRLGVSGIPNYAESVEVAKIYELSRHFKAKIIFLGITTKESLEVLKDKPENIYIDVPIDNLYFTDRQLEGFNTLYKTTPPLRSGEDREALLRGIESGLVDIISSNHISATGKDLPLEVAESGISKLDIFSQLAYSLPISPEKIQKLIADTPAQIFGIENRVAGENFIVVEFGEFSVDPSTFASRSHLTPYTTLSAQIVSRGG